jgi:hypothetical protein
MGLKSMATHSRAPRAWLKYRPDLTFRVKIRVIQVHEGKIKFQLKEPQLEMNVNVSPCCTSVLAQTITSSSEIHKTDFGSTSLLTSSSQDRKMNLQNTITNIKMGNTKSKPQFNEENQRMERSRVVKDPPPPYIEVASDLAVATPDHSNISFPSMRATN